MEYLDNQKKIYILLATYNGAQFLEEQLNSLLVQTYNNWTLYIHDDNSTDNTVDIINKYADKYSNINFLDDKLSTGGAKENFTYLLNKIDNNFDYLMFCDQDDIWLPEKIEQSYIKMKKIEIDNSNIPLLVFTDLTVVEKNLNILSSSLIKYQNKNLDILNSISKMLVENIITGCTVMINKKAKEVSLPISKHAIMHDWWIALQVKKNNGVISYLDKSQILYRQHENNDTGASKFSITQLFSKFSSFKKYKNTAIDLRLNISMSKIIITKLSLLIQHIYRTLATKG